MPVSASNPPPLHAKNCCECASQIDQNARRCPVCLTPQDWRRHLNFFSRGTLALMTALVSVITSGLPVIIHAVNGEDSNITLSLQGLYNNHLKIVAHNTGTRPATWNKLDLHIVSSLAGMKPFDEHLLLGVKEERVENLVFPPSQSTINTFIVPQISRDKLRSYLAANRDYVTCSVTLEWVDFASTHVKSKTIPFDCKDAEALAL